jgi:hypothetical protein
MGRVGEGFTKLAKAYGLIVSTGQALNPLSIAMERGL